MPTATEQQIINRAENHLGLLSRSEQDFIEKIAAWPSYWTLNTKQANWLYDIANKKLGMCVERPVRVEPIDYKARACA